MAAFVASVFGGQPLLISGVTGPITVFNKTVRFNPSSSLPSTFHIFSSPPLSHSEILRSRLLTHILPPLARCVQIYDIFIKNTAQGADQPVYLYFIGWVYLWGAIFHWIAGVTNGQCSFFFPLHPYWLICYRFS